jgi:hypothetical protein
LYDYLELLDVEGLGDVIVGPPLHRFDGRLGRGVGRHHDDRGADIVGFHLPQQIQTVAVRHDDVAQDEIEVVAEENLSPFLH